MSDKRKKRKFDAKREKRRLKRLAADGRLIKGVEIPRGAVAADASKRVPNNSYSPLPLFYVDKEFTCADCGREEIWTAQQQKWYYEVAKGSQYATAVRCRDCRRKRSEQQTGHGDPSPIKHVGSLMKRIRSNIEPLLGKARFEFDGKHNGTHARRAWIEYSRPGLILRCLYEPRDARLVAETLDDKAEYRVVANVALNSAHSGTALLERVEDFTSVVQRFLQTLLPATEARDSRDT